MMNDIIAQETHVMKSSLKDVIRAIEAKIKELPDALGKDPFPLSHSFAKGVYIREIRIPKGYFVVGSLHKDAYFNCILSGDMSVITEDGLKRVKGPCWNIAPAGTKRFGYSHEDTVWVTAHPNHDECRDVPTLEDMIHAEEEVYVPKALVGECKEIYSFFEDVLSTELNFDIPRFRELTQEIYDHEKDGFWSDWTKEQQDLYMSGDWEAFSISRGYTSDEIETLRQWILMKEDGEARGIPALGFIKDLSMNQALKNISKDKNKEILKSSHIPTSKKVPYKNRESLCQVQ
jgi:hypothetical protein